MIARIAARWARVRGRRRRVGGSGRRTRRRSPRSAGACPSSSAASRGGGRVDGRSRRRGRCARDAGRRPAREGARRREQREPRGAATGPRAGEGDPLRRRSWEYAGANNIGGRVTDVVVDSDPANTIYVASAGGGVWKSTDAGPTYTPAWPNNYPQAIGSLARGSDGTLWAGTGEANASGGGITYVGDGVYRSTDGGATWTNVGLGNAGMIGRIAVDPANPNRPRRGERQHLLDRRQARPVPHDRRRHALEAGPRSRPDAAPYTGAVDVAFDPVNPNRVYATLWDHHRNSYLRPYGGIGSGLYVTDNALANPATDVAWERIGNSHVSGPLPSYDASQSGLDVSPTLGRMGVAVAPSDHTRVYLITGESLGNDKGFFVSDNGDRSLADGGPTFVAGGHAGGNPRFEWWFGRLFVDPVNKNHLFKTDVSLRRSSDGGLTWVERRRAARRPARHGLGPERAEPRLPRQRRRHLPLRRERRQRLGARHEHAVAPGVPRRRLADSGRTGSRSASRTTARTAAGRTSTTRSPIPLAANWSSYGGGDGHYVVIDSTDDTYYYSCSQNAGCSGVHDVASTTTTLSAAAAVGATNVKFASVTGLVVGNTITIDSTGANPETVTMTAVGTQGAAGTGVTFTPALAFAHASGATVVKNGVAGHAEPRLRLARQRPALHDRRAARPGSVELGDAVPRLQQPLPFHEPRGDLDADRARRTRSPGRRRPTTRRRTTRSTRASSRRSRRSRRRSPTRTRSTSAPTTGGSGRRPTSA